MARLAPTLQILSLRRLAEAEAQAAMRAARGELELAQRQLEHARRRLLEVEQELNRTRSAQKLSSGRSLPRPQTALELLRESTSLLRKARALDGQRAEVERCEATLGLRVLRLEQHRKDLLACVARREAAELHEALERREQKRLRSQRERAHDDEARDRFALSRVK